MSSAVYPLAFLAIATSLELACCCPSTRVRRRLLRASGQHRLSHDCLPSRTRSSRIATSRSAIGPAPDRIH